MHQTRPTKPGFLPQCGIRRDSPPPWPSLAATSAVQPLEGILDAERCNTHGLVNVTNVARGTAANGTVSSATNLPGKPGVLQQRGIGENPSPGPPPWP